MSEGNTGNFEIAVLQQGHRQASAVLSGVLDLTSAVDLQSRLNWLASAGVVHVALDLTNLTFIDSTGVSVLITTLERMGQLGGSLVVRNASAEALRVFEINDPLDHLSAADVEVASASSSRRPEPKPLPPDNLSPSSSKAY